MKLIKVKNYEEMSKVASEIIIEDINKKPSLVLGFATGKTPRGLYKELVKANRRGNVDFSKIKSFNLDEYYPISKKDKKSYFYYLNKNLFGKINIKKENINLLDGESNDLRGECLGYEKKIKKNPIDIQILGVGVNGHIGFNEPGSLRKSKTRLVKLSEETKKLNKINKNALTIGISTIMKSKKIILLASGKNKSLAIRKLIKEKQNSSWPVTYLRNKKNFIVIIDNAAGSLI